MAAPEVKVLTVNAVFNGGVGPVDSGRLASEVETSVRWLVERGFEIKSIMPVTSGVWAAKRSSYGWGYGFGYTSAVLITGVKTSG